MKVIEIRIVLNIILGLRRNTHFLGLRRRVVKHIMIWYILVCRSGNIKGKSAIIYNE